MRTLALSLAVVALGATASAAEGPYAFRCTGASMAAGHGPSPQYFSFDVRLDGDEEFSQVVDARVEPPLVAKVGVWSWRSQTIVAKLQLGEAGGAAFLSLDPAQSDSLRFSNDQVTYAFIGCQRK